MFFKIKKAKEKSKKVETLQRGIKQDSVEKIALDWGPFSMNGNPAGTLEWMFYLPGPSSVYSSIEILQTLEIFPQKDYY